MATVTCRTPDCGNEGIPLEMNLTLEMDGEVITIDTVQCGVCGQPITDIEQGDAST